MSSTKKWKDISKRSNRYYVVLDTVILSDWARYDYKEDAWVLDTDSFFGDVINSNDADEISEKEARKIVKENGGTNFDNQENLIVE